MKCRFGTAAMWLVVAVLATALAAPLAKPAAAQNRQVTRPQVDRPDGYVWEVIRKNCTTCHGIDDYAFFALDRAGWQSLIATKHKTGAKLSDADEAALLDWLVSKFGPNTKPFPRTYVAQEITEFFSDPEANRLMQRACSNCHDLERVNSSRYSNDKWRVIAIDMRERGAVLTDDELEKLVEWLGRVKGINPNQ
jgi:cytochrome c5